jgi:hypothetical protein
MFRSGGLPFALMLTFAIACGSEGAGPPAAPLSSAPPANAAASPSSGTDAPAPSTDGPGELSDDPIVGIWDVKGTDARGAYEGVVEVRPEGSSYRFTRAVHYPNLTVEDGRELHWLFRGDLSKSGSRLTLTGSLKRKDFIVQRGALKRTAADTPVAVTGDLTLGPSDVTGSIDVDAVGIALTDTWTARKPLPATPIFVDERVTVPAHPAPSAAEKQANFALYSTYQTLDAVKPYVPRPEFQAAVHGNVFDTTDLAFYRSHTNAIRVYDKVVDDISLAEARVRADAYRYTLAEKAARYQADLEARFIDPAIRMIPNGGPVGAGYALQQPSGDGALWTATYLASQYFRYKVTGEASAMNQVALTLDALLELQEITGDWSQFARTLRKAQGAGSGWHAGTGAYANLEWLQDGNNDMIKGLFYGYLLGWSMFCEGGKTGHEALCARVRSNTKHLADDVVLSGANPASEQSNKLMASWMYAVMTDDVAEAITYRAKAEASWTVVKLAIPATAVFYSQGIVDWSGTHLSFVGDVISMLLAQRMNLGNDAESVYRGHIDASQKNLEKQRFPTWHFLEAAMGTGAGPGSPFIKDGVSRLLETQYPKVSYAIDWRISPDFCMDPYPTVPWKADWMDPQHDRTAGLDLYPLFETGPGINYWMTGADYRSGEGYEYPGNDFLHLYWFARSYGLIGPAE